MTDHTTQTGGLTRGTLLRRAGALGAAGLAAPMLSISATRARAATSPSTPLRHLIIDCQENRSFDHYFGFAPFSGRFGVPRGYCQPDGNGGSVAPYRFTSLSTPDIGHSWNAVHDEWNGGAMDGFYTTDGINCMGYYTAAELPFYYSLFDDFTLCGNYFCSLLGPTWPNRFYLAAGTSGGITTNGVWGYGVFDYPIILDLLDAAGVTWKVYNIGWDSVPFGNTDNVFVFWKRYAHDKRTRGSKGDYLNDLAPRPAAAGVVHLPSFARGWDEHPPADVSCRDGHPGGLITALRDSPPGTAPHSSSPTTSTAATSTTCRRRSSTRSGSASACRRGSSRRSRSDRTSRRTTYEHTSTLKFIETVFGLPTLASINHRFDQGTPGGSNNEAANGAATGPPAPPRDGIAAIGDMMECFEF